MMFFLVAIVSALAASATAETEPIFDVNIHAAVAEWVNDEAAAKEIYGEISLWKTGDVTDMNDLFANLDSFNEDISKWNVSKVTSMGSLFYGAISFTSDLSKWNVNSVVVDNPSKSSYMFPGYFGCFDCANAPVALVSHCTQY